MQKIFSVNAYYDGIPWRDVFRVSSVKDYTVSLGKIAADLTSKEAYEHHITEIHPRFHFKDKFESLIAPADSLLSVSVGSGAKKYFFMERYPAKTFALTDISDALLKVIKTVTKARNVAIDVADNRSLPYKDGQFQRVLVELRVFLHRLRAPRHAAGAPSRHRTGRDYGVRILLRH